MKIAIIGQKGGPGKTTVAVNVAAELKRLGESVLIVDADPQLSATAWGERAEREGFETPPIVHMGKRLHRDLKRVANGHDHVVIDTPGRLGPVTRSALIAADIAIIIARPTPMDLDALSQTFELLDEVASALDYEPEARVLISQMVRQVSARDTIAALQDDEECPPILESTVGFRADYPAATAFGQGVVDYNPRGKAAKEIRALVRELLAEEV